MATAPPVAAQPAASASPAAQPGPPEMLRNYNFVLSLDSADIHFTECLGLGMRIEPIRYRESGNSGAVRALPGPVAFAEVVLRYGLGNSTDLWGWLMAASAGTVQRRNVTISQLKNDGTPATMNWNLIGAWPCQWSGVPFDALGRDAAIEELHLAYDRLERS